MCLHPEAGTSTGYIPYLCADALKTATITANPKKTTFGQNPRTGEIKGPAYPTPTTPAKRHATNASMPKHRRSPERSEMKGLLKRLNGIASNGHPNATTKPRKFINKSAQIEIEQA